MNTMFENKEKAFNVARNSTNGHFVHGAKKVIEIDNMPENYIIKADEGSEISIKSKNHGNLDLIKGKGAMVVGHQKDIDELRNEVRLRID